MNAAFHVECVIGNLEIVRAEAIAANLDANFISEVDHLIATAKANREENVK